MEKKFTLNVTTLRTDWMQLYCNIMVLMSTSPDKQKTLDAFQQKCAEFNEEAVTFFDKLEE